MRRGSLKYKDEITQPLRGSPAEHESVTQVPAGPGGGVDGAEVGAAVPTLPTLSEFDTSVWARLTEPDGGSNCGCLDELIDALDSSPELRSAALLRSMERYRDILDGLPSDAPIDTPLTVTAVDVLVLIKTVMSRLR